MIICHRRKWKSTKSDRKHKKLADLEEAQQMLGEQQEQDTLTAEDITDLQLVDSEYMSGTRTTIHDFDCKVKGEANRLQYTLEYHDDGEGFTIHTEKDDIWNRMSTQELERLDVKLGQEVLYYHYHNKTVNADIDKLREIRGRNNGGRVLVFHCYF